MIPFFHSYLFPPYVHILIASQLQDNCFWPTFHVCFEEGKTVLTALLFHLLWRDLAPLYFHWPEPGCLIAHICQKLGKQEELVVIYSSLAHSYPLTKKAKQNTVNQVATDNMCHMQLMDSSRSIHCVLSKLIHHMQNTLAIFPRSDFLQSPCNYFSLKTSSRTSEGQEVLTRSGL